MTTLDELRRANLQEQRRKAEAATQASTAAASSTAAAQPSAEPVAAKPKQTEAAPVAKAKPPVEAPKASAPVEPAPVIAVVVEAPIPTDPPRDAASVELEAPVIEVPHLNGNGHAQAVELEVVEIDAEVDEEEEIVVDEADRKARAIMDRFYRGLAHKVVHPTGVKTTVDMPPDLFWRVKRYCHDHNNVTVRQLFLDLIIAVLEEEGY